MIRFINVDCFTGYNKARRESYSMEPRQGQAMSLGVRVSGYKSLIIIKLEIGQAKP